MAGIVGLLPFVWKAYWRGIRMRKAWAGANLAIIMVMGLLVLPGHIAGCVLAAMRMRTNPEGQGVLLTELMLLGLMIAWIMLPLLAAGIQARGQSLSIGKLIQFPLSHGQLFLIGVANSLVQPAYWLLLVASGFSLLPLAAGPNAWLGLAGGLLFLAASALISWCILLLGNAIFASRRGREIAMSIIAILLFSIIILVQFKLVTEGGSFALEGMGRRILLASADGREGVLPYLRTWTPAAWAAHAALGRALPLAYLAALAGLTLWLSFWSLKRALHHPMTVGARSKGRLRALGSLPGLPPALGAAAVKEWRYLSRTMDAWFSLVIGLGGAILLITRTLPPGTVLLVGIPFTMLMVGAIPMNCFGLDRRAVDRYRLLPLSGRDVLLSKNLAYAMITAVQVGPLILAGAYRFGLVVGLAALCGAAAYWLLLVIWGNWVSVRHPAPREFFNFDNREQAGGILSQLYALAVEGALILVALIGYRAGPWVLLAVQVILLALCAALYRARLARTGRLFEESAELMRERLAT